MDNEETKIYEPQLVDSENVMMITTVDKAKEFLKTVYYDLVLVSRWIPLQNNEIGMSLETKKYNKRLNSYSSEKEQLRPIIKDINITWSYSKEKIQIALKIFNLMGWNNPEIYCPKTAYPLMIRSGRRYSDTSKEAVIIIAPRIESE